MAHVDIVKVVFGIVCPVFLKVLGGKEDIVPDVGGLDW